MLETFKRNKREKLQKKVLSFNYKPQEGFDIKKNMNNIFQSDQDMFANTIRSLKHHRSIQLRTWDEQKKTQQRIEEREQEDLMRSTMIWQEINRKG